MPKLFEANYKNLLCFECAHIEPISKSSRSNCSLCGAKRNMRLHNHFYRYSFFATRYGYQYREYYESSKNSNLKPYLENLDEIYTFIVMAITSGIIGNASWVMAKAAINKMLEKNTITTESKKYNFTKKEVEQLISNIVDYESGFHNLPDKIRSDILEEMLGDAAAENHQLSKKLILLLSEQKNKKNLRQAGIIYKELARRHNRKNRALPPKTKKDVFWSKL